MSRDVCALDFSNSSIQVLVQDHSGKAIRGKTADLPAEAIEGDRLDQPATLQIYLTRLLKDLKVNSPEIRLTVADSACVSRFLEYPKMGPKDLARSLEVEAQRELPMSLRQAYMGWQSIGKADDGQQVLLVAAWRDVVEQSLTAVKGVGRVTAVEPRSMALARAVGMPDAVLVDWTGDDVQVVHVQARLVKYTGSVALGSSTIPSLPRLHHAVASLLPKSAPGQAQAGRVVLLGKLHGREDLAELLRNDALTGRFEIITDWTPAEPYSEFAGTSQVANIGRSLTNHSRATTAESFPAINLMPYREKVVSARRPAVRPFYWVILTVSTLMLIAVMAYLLLPKLTAGAGP